MSVRTCAKRLAAPEARSLSMKEFIRKLSFNAFEHGTQPEGKAFLFPPAEARAPMGPRLAVAIARPLFQSEHQFLIWSGYLGTYQAYLAFL